MSFVEVYFIVLMCLPLLGYWLRGAGGAVAGTAAALGLAAAFHFAVPLKGPPPPANWNPEAKSEYYMGEGIVALFISVAVPAAAIASGVALTAAWALIRYGISRWKRS
jgi:hypothetical protein